MEGEKIREEIKEVWNSFSPTRKPYVKLGTLLLALRHSRAYGEWGYENIEEYLNSELHMPFTNYSFYVAAAKRLARLGLTIEEGVKIEGFGVKKVLTAAKVSKTKDELFQRLNGTFQVTKATTKYYIEPFRLDAKEIHRIWKAKRIVGNQTREFGKIDLMNLVDYIISTK